MVPGDARTAALRKGALEFCVLALLSHGERYGVELVRALADIDGLEITEGTLYPLLSRLRRDGAVETTWQESPSGPPRRYYALSASGRRALHEFKDEWCRYRDAVDRLLGTGEARR
jgi:PadR family transcriptional regulator